MSALVRRRRDVPKLAGKALGLLDRFGALRLGPDSVGFDDEDVEWAKVVRVHTRPVVEVLTETAIRREMERVRKLLPPVPGRKWVLSKVGDGLERLAVAALDPASRPESRSVVSELSYRASFGRRKDLTPGLAVTTILAAMPAVNDSILVTARARGVEVADGS